MQIPYSKPYLTGQELDTMGRALSQGKLSGNGEFTQKCQNWLRDTTGAYKVLLTQSCTSALEMSALLLDIKPGDEVIMPSFTFVSTANAFALRGATPVFVDIRPDTLNLDESQLEAAITPRTRAIVPVHYAGVACEMDTIMAIAERHKIMVVADAAQAIHSFYKKKPLASLGHLSALSFHDTKNIISGEGGALLINAKEFAERSEILWEKGTNRSRFLRGEIDKYTWVELGSSFLPSELTASFLWAQLSAVEKITTMRLALWHEYHAQLADLERQGYLQRPRVPEHCAHNAHIYFVLLAPKISRLRCLEFLKKRGIGSSSHYVPLHNSPAGEKYGRSVGDLPQTMRVSEQLLRLPLWPGLESVEPVVAALREFCRDENRPKEPHL